MEPRRKRPKYWPVILIVALGGVLFAAQPFMPGGSTTAATPAATPSPTATASLADPAATVVPLPSATPAPTTGPSSLEGGDLLGLIARLGIVVLVIVITLYLLKVVMARGRGGAAGGSVVRVIDTIGLGNNRAMYLVDVGDKVLVVGGTATNLNLLSELTDPATLTTLRTPRTSGAAVAAASVGDLFRRTTSRFARPEADGTYEGPAVERLQRMLREQQTMAEPAARVET